MGAKMTSSRARRRDLVLGDIDALPPDLSATLAMLDLDYGRMQKRRFGGADDRIDHLALAERVIKKAYELTGDDGICCVISADVRDDNSGALEMFGTKIVDRAAPWTVSDEIIWSVEPPGPWRDVPASGYSARASAVSGFSQIWILTKHSPAPHRSEVLGRAALPGEEREEAASSVWHVPPEMSEECSDPVPCRVLSRLVLSYSEPGGLVLDPFANGGATAVACEELGRSYVCAFDSSERLDAAKGRIRALAGGHD